MEDLVTTRSQATPREGSTRVPADDSVNERSPLLRPGWNNREAQNHLCKSTSLAKDLGMETGRPRSQSDPEIERRQSYEVPHRNAEESRRRVMYALPALAIGVFLAAADQTIIVSSYGIIGSELDFLDKISWIATG